MWVDFEMKTVLYLLPRMSVCPISWLVVTGCWLSVSCCWLLLVVAGSSSFFFMFISGFCSAFVQLRLGFGPCWF